ncbi:MAG: GTP cyclohydrolase [bacterium]|nr:GTP cyclohydrolase [bacterium]
MFLLLSRYLKPEAEIDRHLPAHRAFLDRQYAAGHFVVSGPLVPRTGGVIVTVDMPRERLDAIMQEDPFLREGVSEYQILEFGATKRAEGFLAALEANR